MGFVKRLRKVPAFSGPVNAAWRSGDDDAWRTGDLLFFYGRCFTSRMIELATWGPSHVGIVCKFRNYGHLLVESTQLCDLPDVLSNEKRAGVQFHFPVDRIAAYAGRVQRMRLADGWWLEGDECDRMAKWLWHLQGRAYDLRNVALAGTQLLKRSSCMPYPDAGSLFCSELCAAALMRVQRLPLANATTFSPASLRRALRHCGTYDKPETIR